MAPLGDEVWLEGAPVVDPVELALPAVAAERAVSEALPETERAVSVAPAEPERMEPDGFEGPVPLVAMAAAWKVEKFFAAVGLIAKTIPL